jgi:uncharacterized protein YigE (DUF2233 family)
VTGSVPSRRWLVRIVIAGLLLVIGVLFVPRLAILAGRPPRPIVRHSFHGARIDVVTLPLSDYRVRLVSLEGGVRLGDVTGTVRTNAGIFEPDFRPTGLLIADGVEVHPLNLGTGKGNFFLQPNGVFSLGAAGAAIVESSEFSAGGVQQATQSGPLLVRHGKLHPLFKAGSANRLIRSGVGVKDEHTVVLAISRDEVSFFDFATFFRDQLGCSDALYLDGIVSGLSVTGSSMDDDTGPFAAAVVADPR